MVEEIIFIFLDGLYITYFNRFCLLRDITQAKIGETFLLLQFNHNLSSISWSVLAVLFTPFTFLTKKVSLSSVEKFENAPLKPFPDNTGQPRGIQCKHYFKIFWRQSEYSQRLFLTIRDVASSQSAPLKMSSLPTVYLTIRDQNRWPLIDFFLNDWNLINFKKHFKLINRRHIY